MAKVITFSRKFPSYHPKAGQPTFFVEAFYKSMFLMKVIPEELVNSYSQKAFMTGFTKHHTIRAGNRFKKGDLFSPRVWGEDINPKSGKSGPYHSKQIILAKDTLIVNTWEIEITKGGIVLIDDKIVGMEPKNRVEKIATNDGLSREDFENWFSKLPFKGQIICWNPEVSY